MPTTLATVTVTGTYLLIDGQPATGGVKFEAPRDLQALLNPANASIHVPTVIDQSLDAAGRISVLLPVTDDADIAPSGWTYRVTENIKGASGRRPRHYNISVPFSLAGGTLDLSEAAIDDPFTESVGLSYVLLPVFNALAARVAFLETHGSGGGGGVAPAEFSKAGTLAVAEGKAAYPIATDRTIGAVFAEVDTAPIDGDLVFQLTNNREPILEFTIESGTNDVTVEAPDGLDLVVGDTLRLDILEVGASGGWDLTVLVLFEGGGDGGGGGGGGGDPTAEIAAAIEAYNEDTTNVHGIANTLALATTSDVTNAVEAETVERTAAFVAHAADQTDVHGILDTQQLATLDDVNAVVSTLAGGIPFDPNETITTGDVRVYHGGLWEAQADLPANTPPLGAGDGSTGDQLLLLARRAGFADYVTGGYGKTVFTVHNANDTGAGSLRATVASAVTAGGGWIIFDPTFNSGVFDITLGSRFNLVGQDITIDGRGCTVTIDGGGTPGASEDGGVSGYSFAVGGATNADFTAGGNETPASNIVICNVAFVSDYGGDNEGSDGGDADDVFSVRYWARGVWVDHCTFTNPDRYHDGLFDVSYGGTDVTVSWCDLHTHHKAMLVYDIAPPDAGDSLPVGITEGDPGPYEVFIDTNTSEPRVLTKVTHHHNLKRNLAQRSPYGKGEGVRIHSYNEWQDEWGLYIDPADDAQYYYPDFPVGKTANSSAGMRVGHDAQMVAESDVFTPYVGATGNALTRAVSNSDEAGTAILVTRNNLFELGSSADADVHADQAFEPSTYYAYSPEVTAGLKARLDLAAGAGTDLWSYLGAAPVTVTVDVQQDGVDLGVGATESPAATLNFAGTGLTVDYEPSGRVATVTVDAGTADPTTFLLVGTSLPAADSTYEAKRFRVVTSLDAPTDGTEYECRHNTDLNVWEWQQVAGLVIPEVIPGQELVHVEYWPTSQQTAAVTLTSDGTTLVDLTTAAIAASWTGVSAATFDGAFTVPPSAAVLVRWSAYIGTASSGIVLGGLSEVGVGTITNSKAALSNTASLLRLTYEKRLGTAVIGDPGDSFTVRPQWADDATHVASMTVGLTKGPFRLQVFASL